MEGLHSDAGAGSRDVDEVGFPHDDRGLDCCRRFHLVERKLINRVSGGGVGGR